MITFPAMVSKAVTESRVISLKLFPCTILIERTVSPDAGMPMICCCAAALKLAAIKKRRKMLLMVNFNRNVAVFVRPVN